MLIDLEPIRKLYESLPGRLAGARRRLGRPLTLSEKILFSHFIDPERQPTHRGEAFASLQPDRVAMQDATAQMALLQFMLAGREKAAVPSTIHCDHLIRAHTGANADLKTALSENDEVYRFLRDVSRKYGIGFWRPGSGIIHQVVFENYAFPGGLMIGTDSHTPNAGGMGMLAIGVGGADAVDVMAGLPWGVRYPLLIGVRLEGALGGWTAPKDVILKVASILTVKGGTGAIVEYFGPGVVSISCTGRGTITNMGAEIGATTSVFGFDARTAAYLRATGRAEVADLAERHAVHLVADPEVAERPREFFDRVIEIDLSTLEPHIVGPHTPDLARPISRMAAAVREEGYPDDLRYCLIGSCTNSSYEDIGRAAHVAEQAARRGLETAIPLMVTPGSETIHATIDRDGQMETLRRAGAQVLANACGPCIGQWKRTDIKEGEVNSILSSYNRNFRRRNDGNAETMSFIGSPEIVTALAFGGRLSFNPLTDELEAPDGSRFRLEPPVADELPGLGFVTDLAGYESPEAGEGGEVVVDPGSERLALLEPFAAWEGTDLEDLPILLKAVGKCTTDHISPAGPWLRYRGHLDRISDNMFIGAANAFGGGATGTAIDLISGRTAPIVEVARHYKRERLGWVVVGDENYGEGSSREHAAMSPRHLGCRAVIVRSFARIHETNLKKQGVLPLCLVDPADYDRFRADDRVSIGGLEELAPGRNLTLEVRHGDGEMEPVEVRHSMTGEQIAWFRAGSTLNAIARRAR